MTILLHPDLPASHSLAAEGVSVAAPQPSGPAAAVAPLRIALVNLMPNKVQTETGRRGPIAWFSVVNAMPTASPRPMKTSTGR